MGHQGLNEMSLSQENDPSVSLKELMRRATPFLPVLLAASLLVSCDGPPKHPATDGGIDTPDGSTPGHFHPQIEQLLQQALASHWDAHQPPGALLAVQQGTRVWSGAAGTSDIDADTDMKPDDLFPIASITKLFVATLVLRLEEEGLLSIEDKLSQYVPSFPSGDNIPLFRLLNHTAGVYDYIFDFPWPAWSTPQPMTPEEIVQLAVDHGPAFEPGSGWGYSSTHYILLGMVIEQVTNEKWHIAQRDRILDPLGLTRTFVAGLETIDEPVVRGYAMDRGTQKDVTDDYHLASNWTAGGMISTSADLTRFFNLLYGGAFLSESSLQKLQEDHIAQVPSTHWIAFSWPQSATIHWGLGLEFIEDSGEKYHVHGGHYGGYKGVLMYRERDGVTVSALVNSEEGNPIDLANRAFAVFP
jgi:D-alanyl-D-alanine carboxypeptidase